MSRPKAVIIAGPTAVGKTEYAIEVAKALNGEIVSADSMQIYKFMNIGSAKPTKQELAEAKHHLVDEIDPRDEFSVFEYQIKARAAIADIAARGKTPIISGGTGLYVNSIVYNMNFSEVAKENELREELEEEAKIHGTEYIHDKLKALDSEAAERIHPNNLKKVIRAIEIAKFSESGVREFSESFVKNEDYDFCLIGLTRDRQELYERVNQRVEILIKKGLVDEVKSLLEMGLDEDDISMKGIGYKEVIGHLKGEYDMPEAIELIQKNTRHYAKRQLTWFRRFDEMKWVILSDFDTKEQAVLEILNTINR